MDMLIDNAYIADTAGVEGYPVFYKLALYAVEFSIKEYENITLFSIVD
jgi:hypothetical protein